MGKLYLAVAFFLAGSSIVTAGYVSSYLPPAITTFLSLLVASLTALAVCGRKMFRLIFGLSPRQWLLFCLQALFGIFLFRLFLTEGLKYLGSAEAGIITGAIPALTAVFARLILKDKISRRAMAGIALTMLGVMLVKGFPELNAKNFNVIGLVLILAAAAGEALFTTLARLFQVADKNEFPPTIQAGLVSTLAMLMCLGPALMENAWAALPSLPPLVWLAIVWYGSVVTVVSFAFMYAGAKRCDGYTLAAFSGLIPLSSLVLAGLLLGETISFSQLLGCFCVVAATLILAGRPRTARPRPLADEIKTRQA